MCLSDTALCWNWKGDKIQAADMMEHLYNGRADADRRNANQRRRSNMDLHNNEQGYCWSRHGEDYTRNETAICSAMRNGADVARRISWTSANTSWPRDRLVYFDTPTTRRPGTAC